MHFCRRELHSLLLSNLVSLSTSVSRTALRIIIQSGLRGAVFPPSYNWFLYPLCARIQRWPHLPASSILNAHARKDGRGRPFESVSREVSSVFQNSLSPSPPSFKKGFFLVPPSPSYNGPRHKGTFQWTLPPPPPPALFFLSLRFLCSSLSSSSSGGAREGEKGSSSPSPLLPPAFCSCSLSPIRYFSSSKKIHFHTNEANFDRLF